METKKGTFIVIEGGDGAGKSTQIKMLADRYGDSVVLSREPGGTPYAEDIRQLALNHELAGEADGKTQFLLMWASRAEHMNHKIIPALNEGKIVIVDRFDSSTFAYNIFAQEQPGLVEYFDHTRKAILETHTPDVYIYLDVDVETGKARTAGRQAENHFDARPSEFHQKIRAGYLEFLKTVPHAVIDANRSPEEIFKDLVKAIEATPGFSL